MQNNLLDTPVPPWIPEVPRCPINPRPTARFSELPTQSPEFWEFLKARPLKQWWTPTGTRGRGRTKVYIYIRAQFRFQILADFVDGTQFCSTIEHLDVSKRHYGYKFWLIL